MSRTRVALVANLLGLGGTEKGVVSFARELDRDRFDPYVIGVWGGGERVAELEAMGLEVLISDRDEDTLARQLEGADVVHLFRAGQADPMPVAAVRRAGVKALAEFNIFGNLDKTPDRHAFDAQLFMSKMCLLRYRDWLKDPSPAFHERHRVLHYPIDHAQLRSDSPGRREARELLGLDPDRPVVGRVGRAADLKWRRIVVDMIPHLLELVADAQVLLVGATEAKVGRLRALGVYDRCTLVEPTVDPKRLAAYYAACDVFASAAEIGESQGLGLAEALALEVPVVTCSTPWVDNAQVEFVEHGRSGWYASHPQPFAEAVADLLTDDAKRAAFGAAGRAMVESRLSAGPLTRQLEALYAALAAGEPPPSEWSPSPREVESFAADYATRAAAEFRPLSARERAEARAERLRERGVQIAHVAGNVARERVPALGPGDLSDRIARSESGEGWRGAAMKAYLAGHRLAARAGIHAVRASYDSPIPREEDLAPTFAAESPMRGIDWDPERQMAFIEAELGGYLAEFRPAADPHAPDGVFRLGNATYDSVDAELLYGIVRWAKPKRYVELGSGYSTLVAWEALHRNGTGELHCYDPYPSAHVLARPELAARLQRVSAQQIEERVVAELESGDVLFVDTSHTVKQGGDVNRIVLDLLPLVAPGVSVHFHDIFLPGDYSPGHIANAHYWTEQYLLQAFLVGNRDWEVLAGGQAVARHAPERLRKVIPSYHEGVSPGAFWIRRRA